jgi:hypothetical protein
MATRRNPTTPRGGNTPRGAREIVAANARFSAARAAGMTTTEAYRSMNRGRSAPARRAQALIFRVDQNQSASARRAGMDPGTR